MALPHSIIILACPAVFFLPYTVAQGQSPCTLGPWQTPAFVGGFGSLRVRNPSILVSQSGVVLVVGNKNSTNPPTVENNQPPELGIWRLRSTARGTIAATELPPPGGRHWFGYPIASFDSRDRLHILWSEPAQGAALASASQQLASTALTSVWHSIFANEEWSKPEEIAAFESMRWTPAFVSSLLALRDGTMAVAIPIFATSTRGGVAFLRYSAGRWDRHEIPLALSLEPSYVDIEALSTGTIALTYVAAASGPGRDINSVFATFSSDGGSHWAPPSLVSRSGTEPAFDARLAAQNNDDVALIWTRSRTGSLIPDRLQSSRYLAKRSRWADQLGIPAANPRNLTALSAPCGAVTVLFFEADDSARTSLMMSSLGETGFSPPHDLFPSLTSFAPSAAFDRRGCLHLIWLAAPLPQREVARPTLAYSQACPQNVRHPDHP